MRIAALAIDLFDLLFIGKYAQNELHHYLMDAHEGRLLACLTQPRRFARAVVQAGLRVALEQKVLLA